MCPDGYQKVGAGHCVSTITPGAVPPNNPDALNNFPGKGKVKQDSRYHESVMIKLVKIMMMMIIMMKMMIMMMLSMILKTALILMMMMMMMKMMWMIMMIN